MDILEACMEARENDDLVAEFNRLTGFDLPTKAKPARGLDAMIDDATGRREAGEKAFAAFFIEVIWTRLPPECFTGKEPTP
jgi:hypothetical protein